MAGCPILLASEKGGIHKFDSVLLPDQPKNIHSEPPTSHPSQTTRWMGHPNLSGEQEKISDPPQTLGCPILLDSEKGGTHKSDSVLPISQTTINFTSTRPKRRTSTTLLPMPDGLKRYQHTRQAHFLTFSCYQRRPFLLSPQSKNTVEQVLEQVRRKYSLAIAAYVLMPEHIHLLTNEPPVTPLATVLQVFKQLTSRKLKPASQPQFWQRRYYDFNVSSPEKYEEKILYIHHNPITRGLVSDPENYPWSSFHHYAHWTLGTIEIESSRTARLRAANQTTTSQPGRLT